MINIRPQMLLIEPYFESKQEYSFDIIYKAAIKKNTFSVTQNTILIPVQQQREKQTKKHEN